MRVKQDYYELLGVARAAEANEIKSAYRRLARECHPDVNPDNPEAEARFKAISEAYSILSDPEKRQRYDAYGHDGVNDQGRGGFGGGAGMDDAFDTLFNMFFDAAGGRETGGRNRAGIDGQDLRADVQLTLEEVATGIKKTLDVTREEACDTCEGSGAEPGTLVETCPQCKGSGQMRQTQSTFLGSFSSLRPCSRCGGTGLFIPTPCGTCKGIGRQRKKSKIDVDIPAGVENGMQVRLVGQGNAGVQGGQPGHLYVVLHVRPHERFERGGPNIACEQEITFSQAALGTTVEIPVFDGAATLKVPAGTQSGTQFTLRGYGLPRLQASGKGDLLIQVKVGTPQALNDEQKHLFKLLARLEEGGSLSDGETTENGSTTHPTGLFDKIKDLLGGG